MKGSFLGGRIGSRPATPIFGIGLDGSLFRRPEFFVLGLCYSLFPFQPQAGQTVIYKGIFCLPGARAD